MKHPGGEYGQNIYPCLFRKSLQPRFFFYKTSSPPSCRWSRPEYPTYFDPSPICSLSAIDESHSNPIIKIMQCQGWIISHKAKGSDRIILTNEAFTHSNFVIILCRWYFRIFNYNMMGADRRRNHVTNNVFLYKKRKLRTRGYKNFIGNIFWIVFKVEFKNFLDVNFEL